MVHLTQMQVLVLLPACPQSKHTPQLPGQPQAPRQTSETGQAPHLSAQPSMRPTQPHFHHYPSGLPPRSPTQLPPASNPLICLLPLHGFLVIPEPLSLLGSSGSTRPSGRRWHCRQGPWGPRVRYDSASSHPSPRVARSHGARVNLAAVSSYPDKDI